MTLRMARPAAALLAIAALGASPPVAGATVDLTALRIRIGSHPAYVRVVVDLTDGRLAARGVEAVDPSPANGSARVRITATRVRTEAAPRSAYGVSASLVQGSGTISLRLAAPRLRFKLLSYSILHGVEERLVVDLWRAAPPTPAATITRGPGGCLALTSVTASAGRFTVRGTERGLFEHQFALQVRGPNGRVLASRGVTAGGGRWSATIAYPATRVGAGTLEAFDLSEKDGALACIVQRRVTLWPR